MPSAKKVGEKDPASKDDLVLAQAAARGDPLAVAGLVKRLKEETRSALRRIDPSPAFFDEVLQTLQVSLLVGKTPAIATYRGEGPLNAWLRASAVRLGLKLRPRAKDDPSLLDKAAEVSPELQIIKDRYRPAFERCFKEELAALPKRSRSLLRLHYVDGLGIDQLASVYRVGRSTAARWLVKERETLVLGLRQRLSTELRIAPEELQSLIKLVVSQLHVSLGKVLA
ncbi:MAG TPA: transcriptional regulator [Myxococcales bacterium]|jgi:RNA polymerase sigma-70 factor (ECF subfamily)|nr:transcriptional regulator [Myxococcales bacterium]